MLGGGGARHCWAIWHRAACAGRLAGGCSHAALTNCHRTAAAPRRRDLEAARTLADQARKREKLKRRELQLYKEEWAARMQGECWGECCWGECWGC